uniref:Ig-like domain-containing protein n=1 Tax=Kryptolebias marmoratus TaxID=37003 RepID=A0A3Q3GNP0_KRYMA
MTLTCVLIWTLLCCCFTGKSRGQVSVTQQPAAVSSAVGGSATIRCTTNENVINSDSVEWYQQKPSESPKLIIYYAVNRKSYTPDRFTGSGSKTDFTLIIDRVEDEDAAVYYCIQEFHLNSSMCFLSAVDGTPPSLTVLPPSSEELQQEKVTLMCLANKGFPSDWSLSWRVDGSSSSSFSWEQSRSPGVLEKDGLYSWSSTLRLPADQWRKVGSVSCEATQGSQTPLTETLRRDQCSQD